jgi:hypothetical protein
MHNTIAYDIGMSIFCGAAVALLGWLIVDGLRTGRLAMKHSAGWLRRDQHPIGFSLMIALMAVIFCLTALGVLALLRDLFYR